METKHLEAGTIKLQIHANKKAAGEAAARAAAEALRQLDHSESGIGVVFATGASQLETLHALTSIPGLPWGKIQGFHLDEYLGMDEDHPASFRRYLRENLTRRVPMGEFFEIDGSSADPDRVRREYVQKLWAADPQLCLLGIGENGHLAFNDPAEANFNDPDAMKVVTLDAECREQQLAEGWFKSLEEVPERALTLTISTLLKIPKLIVSVPGPRKAQSVRRTLEEPISTACPATILRTHPDVTLYLDRDSAAQLNGLAG
ncbi:MAG: glucosamine-6-phosphate deaminase [Acidobacteriaceae bacterium]|jgi:glucosamine-6-phosphate deaminase|nr:glucosamine-6-phosphate deaminase [Acidobacteriaceae bacterium]